MSTSCSPCADLMKIRNGRRRKKVSLRMPGMNTDTRSTIRTGRCTIRRTKKPRQDTGSPAWIGTEIKKRACGKEKARNTSGRKSIFPRTTGTIDRMRKSGGHPGRNTAIGIWKRKNRSITGATPGKASKRKPRFTRDIRPGRWIAKGKSRSAAKPIGRYGSAMRCMRRCWRQPGRSRS